MLDKTERIIKQRVPIPVQTKTRKRLFIFSVLLNVFFIALFSTFFFVRQAREFRQRMLYTVYPHYQATIVMDGNSLTQMGYWESLLSRTDVVNSGRGGFTTSHFLNLLKTDVLDHHPKICFLEGGGNDFSVGVPINRSISNYERIVDTLKKYNVIPVLQSTVYSNSDTLNNRKVDSLNTLVKELARQKQVDYLELNDVLAANGFLKTEYTTDGTHLTDIAYPLWAKKVKAILAKYKL